MGLRVSENMKFNSAIGNLYNIQNDYNDLLEKMATQKRINRISDDPSGMSKILGCRQIKASIDQYCNNIDSGTAWLTITESKLASAGDLLSKARELAISQASGTASASTRSIAAMNVQSIIDEMKALANSKLGDRYLFSGSRNDVAPFSAAASEARIEAKAAEGNSFSGTLTAVGTYSGAVNKTYAVKIVNDGADYQVSADGGRTWGSAGVVADLQAGIPLGDGITLTLGAGTFAENDVFYVNGYAAGYYNGNGEDLSIQIGKGNATEYNVTGAEAFTDNGAGKVDIFKTLNDLMTALESNEADQVLSQVNNLKEAQDQISLCVSKCGIQSGRLETAKSDLQDLQEEITKRISNTEDVDITEIATQFAMKEMALQASYAMASKIGTNTILDFLK
ncbi:MAG: flagellar hook-associated protein FlgL [Deltaproteobacteria bacterium]|nr:flagellar hook-associated protein FlgL [Deltaproteobacteria bacterium]